MLTCIKNESQQWCYWYNLNHFESGRESSRRSHGSSLCEGGRWLIEHLFLKAARSPSTAGLNSLICSSPRRGVRLVSSHILACHLVSPAWHHRGAQILSYSYSTSILFPLLFYSVAPALLHCLYLFLQERLAREYAPPRPRPTSPLIGGSTSCPIKCNLEAPSRAIRAASLPTSCNEAQHILESIAPLVSPNGTSLLSKKQCKWKWTYSLASRREKPLLLSACNGPF